MSPRRAYLDIETTGLSRYYCDITVIGVAIETASSLRLVQLFGKSLNGQRLLNLLDDIDEIYTYNGSRFDLPFIETRLSVNLRDSFIHKDLMYTCWKQNLKGGLKSVERKLGIKRRFPVLDGRTIIELGLRYLYYNDTIALRKLLAYNAEDVINLRKIRLKLTPH